ncbi:MAG: FAD-dependent oxidoreductase [Acidimicrobiales bacterium]
MVDVAVLGGGPAGATAAARLAADGFVVVVVDPLGIGGALINVDHLPDHPDHPEGIAGWDLAAVLGERALAAGATVTMGRAGTPTWAHGTWTVPVESDRDGLQARAVLVATGCRPRPLPGDADGSLEGRGVSYCAVCDGGLFAGRSVVVVGDGPVAFAEARTLAETAAAVTVVVAGPEPVADPSWVAAAVAAGPVTVLTGQPVTGVTMADDGRGVTGVETASGAAIAAGGVFGALDPVPNSEPVAALVDLDPDGRLPVDHHFAVHGAPAGLFAAGDVRRGTGARAAAAEADGAQAAAAVAAFLQRAGL